MIATSGIESKVKIWYPTADHPAQVKDIEPPARTTGNFSIFDFILSHEGTNGEGEEGSRCLHQ
jgi:hypothetical protein